jgi:hypothetical protein
MPIPVALEEDSLIEREGVRQLLAVNPEIESVAAVGVEPSLRQACEQLGDHRMPTSERRPSVMNRRACDGLVSEPRDRSASSDGPRERVAPRPAAALRGSPDRGDARRPGADV